MPTERHVHSVSAIPINREGRILLQQRDDRPDLAFPGCWTTFGGAMEAGETPDEALRRELLEEIELELPMRLWKVLHDAVERDGDVIPVTAYVFVGPIDRLSEEITLNEGQALGYFGLDDLAALKIGFGFETLFREVFAALADGTLKVWS